MDEKALLKRIESLEKKIKDLEKPHSQMFGRSYGSVGSSSSDLILKTKGQVKVQYGNTYIDLVKNGKLNANLDLIFIGNGSQNGLHIIKSEDGDQVILKYNGTDIPLTSNNVGTTYVSFMGQQETPAASKIQALENIGFYHKDLSTAISITGGIIYNEADQKLYIIKDGKAVQYTVQFPNPFTEQLVIQKEAKQIGSLVIKGKNRENGLFFDSMQLYNTKDSSVITSDVPIQIYTEGKQALQIEQDRVYSQLSFQSNTFQSPNFNPNFAGFRLYIDYLGKAVLEVDKVIERDKEEEKLELYNHPIYSEWNLVTTQDDIEGSTNKIIRLMYPLDDDVTELVYFKSEVQEIEDKTSPQVTYLRNICFTYQDIYYAPLTVTNILDLENRTKKTSFVYQGKTIPVKDIIIYYKTDDGEYSESGITIDNITVNSDGTYTFPTDFYKTKYNTKIEVFSKEYPISVISKDADKITVSLPKDISTLANKIVYINNNKYRVVLRNGIIVQQKNKDKWENVTHIGNTDKGIGIKSNISDFKQTVIEESLLSKGKAIFSTFKENNITHYPTYADNAEDIPKKDSSGKLASTKWVQQLFNSTTLPGYYWSSSKDSDNQPINPNYLGTDIGNFTVSENRPFLWKFITEAEGYVLIKQWVSPNPNKIYVSSTLEYMIYDSTLQKNFLFPCGFLAYSSNGTYTPKYGMSNFIEFTDTSYSKLGSVIQSPDQGVVVQPDGFFYLYSINPDADFNDYHNWTREYAGYITPIPNSITTEDTWGHGSVYENWRAVELDENNIITKEVDPSIFKSAKGNLDLWNDEVWRRSFLTYILSDWLNKNKDQYYEETGWCLTQDRTISSIGYGGVWTALTAPIAAPTSDSPDDGGYISRSRLQFLSGYTIGNGYHVTFEFKNVFIGKRLSFCQSPSWWPIGQKQTAPVYKFYDIDYDSYSVHIKKCEYNKVTV